MGGFTFLHRRYSPLAVALADCSSEGRLYQRDLTWWTCANTVTFDLAPQVGGGRLWAQVDPVAWEWGGGSILPKPAL